MDSLDTHPMPLGELTAREPRKLRQVTPWADNVSRPWSETMPAPDAAEAIANAPAPITRRLVRWALAAALLGVAVYALRWLLRR